MRTCYRWSSLVDVVWFDLVTKLQGPDVLMAEITASFNLSDFFAKVIIT